MKFLALNKGSLAKPSGRLPKSGTCQDYLIRFATDLDANVLD